MLNRYVHPSQEDMDRAMEWYSRMQPGAPALAEMLVDFQDGKTDSEGWPGPTFGPTSTPKSAKTGQVSPMSRRRGA
jgi:hypothetical protein